MREEKRSFVHMMNLLMGIQMATVSVLLIIFAFSVYHAARKETDIAAENVLNIYVTQMENRIQKVDTQLTIIINEEMDLYLLESGDDMERHYASMRLSQYINDMMAIDQSADIFVITEAEHNICIDAKADNLSYSEKNRVRERFMGYRRHFLFMQSHCAGTPHGGGGHFGGIAAEDSFLKGYRYLWLCACGYGRHSKGLCGGAAV